MTMLAFLQAEGGGLGSGESYIVLFLVMICFLIRDYCDYNILLIKELHRSLQVVWMRGEGVLARELAFRTLAKPSCSIK